MMCNNKYSNEKLQIIMDIYTSINIKYLNYIGDKTINILKLDKPVQPRHETYVKIIANYDIIYKIIQDIHIIYWTYYDLCDLRKEKNYYIKLNDDLYNYLKKLFNNKNYDIIMFIINFIS